MVSNEILISLLGSAVAASLITALFSKAQMDKSVIIDNIIKERKAWRDKLRSLVSDTEYFFKNKNANGIACIEAQLVVLLNPYDEEDKAIVKTLNTIPSKWDRAQLQEFMDRVAYLLKHDWERVKQESTTRISPQTLSLASFSVAIIIIATELFFSLDAVAHSVKILSLWLAATLFFIAIITNYPKKPLSRKKFLSWLINKPFREPYRDRNKR